MNFKLFLINILLICVVFPQSISTKNTLNPIVQIPQTEDQYKVVFIGFEGNGIYKKAQLYAITQDNSLKELSNFQFTLPENDTNYFVSAHLGDITGEGMQDFVLVLTNPNSGTKIYTWSVDRNNVFARLAPPFLIKTDQTESYPTTTKLSPVYPDKDQEIVISFGSPDRKTIIFDYLGEIKQTEIIGESFLSNLAGPIIMKTLDQNEDGLDDIYILNNGEIKKEATFLSPERTPEIKTQPFLETILDVLYSNKFPSKIFLLSSSKLYFESWDKTVQLQNPVNKIIYMDKKILSLMDKKGNIYNYDVKEKEQKIELINKVTPNFNNNNFTQINYLVIEEDSSVILSHNNTEIIYQPLYYNLEVPKEEEKAGEKKVEEKSTNNSSDELNDIIEFVSEKKEIIETVQLNKEPIIPPKNTQTKDLVKKEKIILNSDTVNVNIGQNTNIFIDLNPEYNFIDLETIQKPKNMSFSIDSLSFNWTPNKSETGYHHLEYDIEYLMTLGYKKEKNKEKLTIVNETEKVKEVKHFTIFVNSPPTIEIHPQNYTIQAERLFQIPLKTKDPDIDQNLNVYYFPKLKPEPTIDIKTFIWTPQKTNIGENRLQLFVTDGMTLDSISLVIKVDTLQQKIIEEKIINTTVNREFVFGLPILGATKYLVREGPQNLRITKEGIIHWVPINTQLGLNKVIIAIENSNNSTIYELEIFVNAPPVISYRPNNIEYIEYGEIFKYQVQSFDQNINQKLTLKLVEFPEKMTFNDGAIEWEADLLDFQDYTIELSDGIDKDIFSGTIYVNDKPKVVNLPPQHIILGETFNHILQISDKNTKGAQDKNGPNLVTIFPQKTPFKMNINDKTLTWTPETKDLGLHEISLEVTDGVEKVIYEFTILVNDTPVIISSDSLRVQVGDTLIHKLQAEDQNNDTVLTYGIRSNLKNMMLNVQTGLITWIPTIEDLGTHEIQVSVNDGFTPNNESQTISILVYSLPQFINKPPKENFVDVNYVHVVEAQDGFGNTRLNKDVYIAMDSTTFIESQYDTATSLLSILSRPEELGIKKIYFSLKDNYGNIIKQTFEINVIISPCENIEGPPIKKIKEQISVDTNEEKQKTKRELRKERRNKSKEKKSDILENQQKTDTLFITEYDTVYNTQIDTVYNKIRENQKVPIKKKTIETKQEKIELNTETPTEGKTRTETPPEPLKIVKKETITIDKIETITIDIKEKKIPPPPGHKVGYIESFEEQKWGQRAIQKKLKTEILSSQLTQVKDWKN